MALRARTINELAEMICGTKGHDGPFRYRSSKYLSEFFENVGTTHHPIADPDANREVLVDHAFIIAGGTIIKGARNWLGGRLDALRRSQVTFLGRDDILRLFITSKMPMPYEADFECNMGSGDEFRFQEPYGKIDPIE